VVAGVCLNMRRLCLAAFAMLLALPSQSEPWRVTTGIVRPLHQAIDLLAQRHRWRISYEEAPLRYSGDFFEHGPKLGILTLDYDPADGPGAVLRQLVAEHERRGGVGRFEVTRLGRRWLVKVRQMRDERGQWADARSPLETRIGFKQLGWHANGLGEIWWQLREKYGVAVNEGGLAPGMPPTLMPAAGRRAGNWVARDVIAGMKQLGLRGESADYDADWYLVCAGERYGCVFNYVRAKPLFPQPPPPPGWSGLPLPYIPRPALAIQ
jgi:hypothetical protein